MAKIGELRKILETELIVFSRRLILDPLHFSVLQECIKKISKTIKKTQKNTKKHQKTSLYTARRARSAERHDDGGGSEVGELGLLVARRAREHAEAHLRASLASRRALRAV